LADMVTMDELRDQLEKLGDQVAELSERLGQAPDAQPQP
jgi:DNA-binding ferritin-like protein